MAAKGRRSESLRAIQEKASATQEPKEDTTQGQQQVVQGPVRSQTDGHAACITSTDCVLAIRSC